MPLAAAANAKHLAPPVLWQGGKKQTLTLSMRRDDGTWCTIAELRHHLQSRFKTEVVIRDSGMNLIEDSSGSMSLFQDAEHILAFPAQDGQKSAYFQKINFEPHPKAITDAGDYLDHEQRGQRPLAYALAEFLDNSLHAIWQVQTENSLKKISLLFVDNTLSILDSGIGMDTATVQDMATFALAPSDRGLRMQSRQGQQNLADVQNCFLNADISRFGVGSKQATFFIGSAYTVITKRADSDMVCEFTLSKDELLHRWKHKKPVYEDQVLRRHLKDLSASALPRMGLQNHPEVLRLMKDQQSSRHFTLVLITNVSPNHASHLEKEPEDIAKGLANIYHFYIHGKFGNCKNSSSNRMNIDSDFNMTLQVIPRNQSPRVFKIAEVQDDISQFLQIGKSEFLFHLILPDSTIVMGRIYYFPFLNDSETLPGSLNAEEEVFDIMDDDNEEQVAAQSVHNVFRCFWQGRLIPYSEVQSLPFMALPKAMEQYRKRLKGMLFLDDRFPITQNKLRFADLDDLYKEDTRVRLGIPLALHAMEKELRSEAKIVTKKFQAWVEDCHSQYDREVRFSGLMKGTEPLKGMVNYRFISYGGHDFSTDDYAGFPLKGKGNSTTVFGIIQYFMRPRLKYLGHVKNEPENITCSGGKVVIKVLSGSQNEKELKTFRIREMDKETPQADIKRNADEFIRRDRCRYPERIEIAHEGRGAIPDVVRAGYTFPGCTVSVLGGYDQVKGIHPKLTKIKGSVLVVIQTYYLNGNVDTTFEAPANGRGLWGKKLTTAGQWEIVYSLKDYDLPRGTVSHPIQVTPGIPHSVSHSGLIEENELSLGQVGDLKMRFKVLDMWENPCDPKDVVDNLRFDHHIFSLSDVKMSSTGNGSFKIISAVINSTLPLDAAVVDVDFNVLVGGECIGVIPLRVRAGAPTQFRLHEEIPLPLRLGNGEMIPPFALDLVDDAQNVTALPKLSSGIRQFKITLINEDGSPIPPRSVFFNGVSKKPLIVRPPVQEGLCTIPFSSFQVLVREIFGEGKLEQPLNILITPISSLKLDPFTIPIVLIPGDSVSSMELRLQNDNASEFRVGQSLQPYIVLRREDSSVLDPPYPVEMVSAVTLSCSWIENPIELPSDGILPALQASTVAQEQLLKVNLLGAPVPIESTLKLTLKPGPAVKWKVSNPIHLTVGKPFGNGLVFWLEDEFHNLVSVPEEEVPTISVLCGDEIVESRGDLTLKSVVDAEGAPPGTAWIIPGMFLLTQASAHIFKIESAGFSARRFNFPVYAGAPDQIHLRVKGASSVQEQTVSILSRCTLTVAASIVDAAGNVVDFGHKNKMFLKCMHQDLRAKFLEGTSKELSTCVEAPIFGGCAEFSQLFFHFRSSAGRSDQEASVEAFVPGHKDIKAATLKLVIQPFLSSVHKIKLNVKCGVLRAGDNFPPFEMSFQNELGEAIHADNELQNSLALQVFGPDDNIINCYGPLQNQDDGVTCISQPSDIVIKKAGMLKWKLDYTETRESVRPLLDSGEAKVSAEASVQVSAGETAKLMISQGPSPADIIPVSNVGGVERRTVFKEIHLILADKFGNATNAAINDEFVENLMIGVNPKGGPSLVLPQRSYADNNKTLVLKKMQISDGSEGKDAIYTVSFKPVEKFKAIDAALISFQFTSNLEVHKRNEQMARRRTELKVLEKQGVESVKRVTNELNSVNKALAESTARLQVVWEEYNLDQADINNCRRSESLMQYELRRRTDEKRELDGAVSRERNNPKIRQQHELALLPDFVCTVGNMATVESRDDCRLVSQCLGHNLDVVVMRKVDRHLVNRYRNVQFLPLDTISQRLPPRVLPHKQANVRSAPSGNPIFMYRLLARNRAIGSISSEDFLRVICTLVRNTLVIDTFDDAQSYRRMLRAHDCPTIFTRDGHIIKSSGIVGGRHSTIRSYDNLVRSNMSLFGIEPTALVDRREKCISSVEALQNALESIPERARLLEQKAALMEQRSRLLSQAKGIQSEIKSLFNGTAPPASSPASSSVAAPSTPGMRLPMSQSTFATPSPVHSTAASAAATALSVQRVPKKTPPPPPPSMRLPMSQSVVHLPLSTQAIIRDPRLPDSSPPPLDPRLQGSSVPSPRDYRMQGYSAPSPRNSRTQDHSAPAPRDSRTQGYSTPSPRDSRVQGHSAPSRDSRTPGYSAPSSRSSASHRSNSDHHRYAQRGRSHSSFKGHSQSGNSAANRRRSHPNQPQSNPKRGRHR